MRKGERKRETEGLRCTAREQAIRTNSVKYSIDKTSESITHIISACPNLAKNQYRKRHETAAEKTHWLLCKNFHLECNDKWYEHVPDSFLENEGFKTLWDFSIQTDKIIEHRRLDIVCIDKITKSCLIIDITIPGDQNIMVKEQEKIDKYQDLRIELGKLWKLKTGSWRTRYHISQFEVLPKEN